jgi:hypothetical protein
MKDQRGTTGEIGKNTWPEKKKTNRLKYKRDELVDRKKIPYIYIKQF